MTTFTKEQAGKTHNLKIWPEYFAAVRVGLKRAELRCNDRDYQAGDTLELCEWDPNEEAFTGEYLSVTVTHVAELGQLMPGYVLLSITLTSLEAEAVAWTDAEELRDAKSGGSGYLFAIGGDANKFADPRRQLMLYTAPPVPPEAIKVARAALDYIDALPPDVVAYLPAMPGFDRDWAENALQDKSKD
jgi:hypothetical protein